MDRLHLRGALAGPQSLRCGRHHPSAEAVPDQDEALVVRPGDEIGEDGACHVGAVLGDVPRVRHEAGADHQGSQEGDACRGLLARPLGQTEDCLLRCLLAQCPTRQDGEGLQLLGSPVDAVDRVVGVARIHDGAPPAPPLGSFGEEPVGNEYGGRTTLPQLLDPEGGIAAHVVRGGEPAQQSAEARAHGGHHRGAARHAQPPSGDRAAAEQGQTMTGRGSAGEPCRRSEGSADHGGSGGGHGGHDQAAQRHDRGDTRRPGEVLLVEAEPFGVVVDLPEMLPEPLERRNLMTMLSAVRRRGRRSGRSVRRVGATSGCASSGRGAAGGAEVGTQRAREAPDRYVSRPLEARRAPAGDGGAVLVTQLVDHPSDDVDLQGCAVDLLAVARAHLVAPGAAKLPLMGRHLPEQRDQRRVVTKCDVPGHLGRAGIASACDPEQRPLLGGERDLVTVATTRRVLDAVTRHRSPNACGVAGSH